MNSLLQFDSNLSKNEIVKSSCSIDENNESDLEIGQPRFGVLGHALCRAGLRQQFFAALAVLHPKGVLDLGRPSKNFSRPRYLI